MRPKNCSNKKEEDLKVREPYYIFKPNLTEIGERIEKTIGTNN